MTPTPRPRPVLTVPGTVKLADAISPPEATPAAPQRLLWGWRELVLATGINRRTLERELSAGRFPKPTRRVGRRPYWKPSDIARWAGGG
jgi:predicted DNA-binding transcriptional regulator AlpA